MYHGDADIGVRNKKNKAINTDVHLQSTRKKSSKRLKYIFMILRALPFYYYRYFHYCIITIFIITTIIIRAIESRCNKKNRCTHWL